MTEMGRGSGGWEGAAGMGDQGMGDRGSGGMGERVDKDF